MASYVIPEEIVGIPLFVPSNHDFFLVEDGGMPNGDDCLIINGAVNRDYKAFQAAQTLTPNVFKSKTAIHSQVFWMKAPSTAVSNTNAGEHTMMCVDDATDGQLNPAFGPGTWHIGAVSGGTGRITYKQGASGLTLNIDGARTGDWKMVTITNDGTWCRAYLDAVEAEVISATVAGSAISSTGLMLCIGAYSDVGTLNGYEQQWRLGKWTFHDHVLNATERAILYNAMVSPP